MTTILGIRDLARNIDILQQYDYVDIEDKKTHEYKGLFLSPAYAKEFKAYIEAQAQQKKHDKFSRLKRYAGKGSIESQYDGLPSKQIKEISSQERIDA